MSDQDVDFGLREFSLLREDLYDQLERVEVSEARFIRQTDAIGLGEYWAEWPKQIHWNPEFPSAFRVQFLKNSCGRVPDLVGIWELKPAALTIEGVPRKWELDDSLLLREEIGGMIVSRLIELSA